MTTTRTGRVITDAWRMLGEQFTPKHWEFARSMGTDLSAEQAQCDEHNCGGTPRAVILWDAGRDEPLKVVACAYHLAREYNIGPPVTITQRLRYLVVTTGRDLAGRYQARQRRRAEGQVWVRQWEQLPGRRR